MENINDFDLQKALEKAYAEGIKKGLSEKTEKRILNIMFAKGGSGSKYTKLSLPITWVRAMNISEEEREVELLFDGEKIVIQKRNVIE